MNPNAKKAKNFAIIIAITIIFKVLMKFMETNFIIIIILFAIMERLNIMIIILRIYYSYFLIIVIILEKIEIDYFNLLELA